MTDIPDTDTLTALRAITPAEANAALAARDARMVAAGLRWAAAVADSRVVELNREMARWQANLRGRPSVTYRIARAERDARQSVRDAILAAAEQVEKEGGA